MVKKGAMPKVDKKPEPKQTTSEPKQTTSEPEPKELGIASFVDKSKDPQSYVNRYNNEITYKKWFDDNYKEYSSIYQAVGLKKPTAKSKLKNHYMLTTSVAALLTAIGNLFIIFWMSGPNSFVEMIIGSELELTALNPGLGLGAIGLITFFGVSLSSSIFEEHRHKHGNEQKGNLISNTIVGKGIMRKGLAASLVITYIVLIGLSFSAGNLYTSFSDVNGTNNIINGTDNDASNINGTSLNNSTTPLSSQDVNTNIVIKDIVTLGTKVKSIEDSIQAKESNSLVQHFTIVISLVVSFYFSANFITAYIDARKEDKTSNDPLKILKARLAKDEIDEKKYKKLKALIEK